MRSIHQSGLAGFILIAALAGCDSSSTVSTPGTPGGGVCPSARVATAESQLVSGPLARGRLGDLVLDNDRLRAVVQKGGRNWFNIAQFGGNIIDAVPKDSRGRLAAEDQYEEAVLGTNVESAPNYQSVVVLQAGGRDADGNCMDAVVRATGPDDLLDFVNGSSAIRDMGFSFPDSADDVDLPVTIQTDYILSPGASYVTMQTTLINESDADLSVYMVEYMNGSGEVEVFQHGYGFGELLVTAPCDSCRYAIYSGHEGGSGVSYGIVHDFDRTSSVSVSGVTVLVYSTDALPLFAAGAEFEPAPFTVPGDGELTLSRWFVVGDGDVASILDVKHALFEETTGTLRGRVTDAAGPVAGAEIAVIGSNNDFEPLPANIPGLSDELPSLLRGPDTLVVNHFRTDSRGEFAGTLPPGSYELRLNVPGRAAGEPSTVSVDITADAETVQDFSVPQPARLRVQVVDGEGSPVAAKVQLIGTDTSPDAGEPQNQEDILFGAAGVTVRSGIFGDALADRFPPGVVLSEFAVRDGGSGGVTVGDTGELLTEPGSFQLSVSHGPRYSEYVQDVELTAGALTTVTARVVEVLDTAGYVYGDFHVHAFNSPDSEVTNRERVATYLAEDMDFFTPSDHGMRVDFEPLIAEMGVGGLLASAPSAEITTFDYGHFNAWPVGIETHSPSIEEPSQSTDPKISRGANDWGGAAPAGEDFPSAGNYSLTPAEIFADAKADPLVEERDVVMQINHVDSHFGAAGLEIDTGQTPPLSAKDPASKRLPPGAGNLFSDGFDSLELWIGVDGRTHQFEHFLGENAGDWFNMLNQGILKTFVSNSDTHDRRLTSLSTRNQMSVPAVLNEDGRPDPALLRTDPHAVGDAIIGGYSVGSNALFLELKARTAAGLVAGLEQTDTYGSKAAPVPLGAVDEALDLSLEIQGADWAEYDQIAVFVNGATQRHTDEFGQPSSPPRYALCDPAVSLQLDEDEFSRQSVTVASIEETDYTRFESRVDIELASPGSDYWFVVLVQGRDGVSRPLWPVVPNDYVEGDGDLRTRTVDDVGTVALTVSNPVFVDADGDGSWTPPGIQSCDSGGLFGLPLKRGTAEPLLRHAHSH